MVSMLYLCIKCGSVIQISLIALALHEAHLDLHVIHAMG